MAARSNLFETRDWAACGLWAAVAAAIAFFIAGHVDTLSWNYVEFLIADNLREFGVYATGAEYPPAVWRPPLAAFIVLAVEGVVHDPVLTFRLIAGLALGTFAACTYLIAWRLWGTLTANATAFLAATCPAVTTLLIDHVHSFSHLAMLVSLSPALALSVHVMAAREDRPHGTAAWWYIAAAAFWGLACLARAELVMAVVVFFAAWVFRARTGRRFAALAVALAVFLGIILSYAAWRDSATAEYGLLNNRPIYQFYGSQGWSVPPPGPVKSDIEADGYAYAIELYGTPESNDESVLRAIGRNPAAFAERVAVNIQRLFGLLVSPKFFFPTAVIAILLAAGFFRRMSSAEKTIFVSAVAAFWTCLSFLALHIDARYITISVPFGMVIASFPIGMIARREGNSRRLVTALIVVGVGQTAFFAASLTKSYRRPVLDPSIERNLAEGFIATSKATRAERGRMIVYLGVAPKDPMAFPYLSGTSLSSGIRDDLYPIDRIFAFPRCWPTHIVLPAGEPLPEVLKPLAVTARSLGPIEVTGLGLLNVWEFRRGGCVERPRTGSVAARLSQSVMQP